VIIQIPSKEIKATLKCCASRINNATEFENEPTKGRTNQRNVRDAGLIALAYRKTNRIMKVIVSFPQEVKIVSRFMGKSINTV